MISNNICNFCQHILVCSKQTTLEKFDNDSKKFIGMDIAIERCNDFLEIINEDTPERDK